MDGIARADGRRASGNPCRGWRTTATCAARANSSPTSACPACAIWPSCAALSRMRASVPSASPPAPRPRCSSRPTSWACSRSLRCRDCRDSNRPCSRCWQPTRCGMSARRSLSAWPQLAPRPKTSPPRSRSTSTNCRRWWTCARHSSAKRRCTSTGTTTSSWRRSSRSHRNVSPNRRRSWCGGACARHGNACRRWKAAVSSPPGIGGSNNC